MNRPLLSKTFYRLVAIVIVSAAALLYVTRQLSRPPAELTYVPKPAKVTREVALLQQYVRINTSNPPGNEQAGARFLAGEIERRTGIVPEIIETAPGRANVYARIRGRSRGGALLLLSHIDVVPADKGRWDRPPFSADILLNMIYGRGVLDMKSITICQLEAFVDVARSGRPPLRDLVFLATADEERGGTYGVAWLLKNRPDVFEDVEYALNEGGVTEVAREQVTYFGIETGSKQFVRLNAVAADRATLERARLALEPHFTRRVEPVISDELAHFFRSIAPHRKQYRSQLSDVRRAVETGDFWLLHPSYRDLTVNSMFMSGPRREGNRYVAALTLYNLPEQDPQARIAEARSLLEPRGVTLEVLQITGPARISSAETPFFQLIRREVQREYGRVPVGPMILGRVTTDCRYLRARGVTCYGMWPYPVDIYQSWGIHGANERLRIDWFVRGVELTRSLVQAYVAPQ